MCLLSAFNPVVGAAEGATGLMCEGAVCVMYYDNIQGTEVCDLTSNPKYVHEHPDRVDTLMSGYFETQVGYGDEYGAMIEGWLLAPVTGLPWLGLSVLPLANHFRGHHRRGADLAASDAVGCWDCSHAGSCSFVKHSDGASEVWVASSPSSRDNLQLAGQGMHTRPLNNHKRTPHRTVSHFAPHLCYSALCRDRGRRQRLHGRLFRGLDEQ